MSKISETLGNMTMWCQNCGTYHLVGSCPTIPRTLAWCAICGQTHEPGSFCPIGTSAPAAPPDPLTPVQGVKPDVRPFTCPVCGGCGQFGVGLGSQWRMEPCVPCGGKGIVWGPP